MVDTSQVMEPEQNPAMAEPDKPFPFLKLPPELRNRVYELIFTPKTPIFISPELIWYRKIRYFRGVPDDGIHTRHHLFRIDEAANILLVNRQVYLEAVPIPYKNVEFKFKRDWSFLELFMTAIGRTNQACIRHITYTQSYYHSEYPEDILVNNRLKDLVESSPNLEKLEVSSPYACSRYFMKKVGLSDARLGSLLQHKGSLFLETSHGLVRHSMSYMIEDFERCIDKIVGADAAQKQKYLDLLEFTNEWRRPSRGPIV